MGQILHGSALEQSMQRRSREMRDGRLEGIKAIVERSTASSSVICQRTVQGS